MEVPRHAFRRTSLGRFYVRANTCDEVVLRPDYWVQRALVPAYQPSVDDLLVDVGAHIGGFAVPVALRNPGVTIHAVEPSRESFRLLERNIALNGVGNTVRAHQLAIAGTSADGFLNHGADSWADSFARVVGPDSEPVRAQSLREFLMQIDASRVHHLKLNVEGAEYEILLSTDDATLRLIDHLLIEYHPVNEFSVNDLTKRLRACDFHVMVDRDPEEDGKGWLSASC